MELKVTQEAVLRAMEKCPTAKNVLLELFPECGRKQVRTKVATDACFEKAGGKGNPNGVEGTSREMYLTTDFLTSHKFTKITFEWEE